MNPAQQTYNRPVLILRSTLYWIWLTLCTTLVAIPVLVIGLFSRKLGIGIGSFWAKANMFGLKHICGLSCKVHGVENIPDHGCIVMSKHQSSYETFMLASLLDDFVFVAKRSLVLIPVFGWAIYLMKFILIDRKSGRSAVAQMVEQSRTRVANGTHVVVFPEGTRMPVNAAPAYRAGGAVVAAKIAADILPVAHNSGEYWPRMGYIKWPGEISMHIGPVIKSDGKTPNQLMAETQEWIENKMQEITVLDRFPYHYSPAKTA